MECGKPTAQEANRAGFQCQLYKCFQAILPRHIIAPLGPSVFSPAKVGLICQPHRIVARTGTYIKCLAEKSKGNMVVIVYCL